MGITKDIKEFFTPQPEEASAGESSRFVLTEQQQLGGMLIYVVTDRQTGVSYLTKPGNDCPLTPLLDADGKPLLCRGDR